MALSTAIALPERTVSPAAKGAASAEVKPFKIMRVPILNGVRVRSRIKSAGVATPKIAK